VAFPRCDVRDDNFSLPTICLAAVPSGIHLRFHVGWARVSPDVVFRCVLHVRRILLLRDIHIFGTGVSDVPILLTVAASDQQEKRKRCDANP
jgi:hypothetical protein